ncbi:branched-chain-amino-acid aminotransferase-like protein 2 [Acanthaster planci]|uniref:Branched-chain-amino-acid aminotransferase-like protein 2 n=1 Tax=Acanthaster planci TaxID=133434 RepID=A0A8B7YXL2_ACAPL|nr:branched-chain-amino-acid aminotransferase-like protein 2 [Acanthaster planci]XP_022098075.1 branched-chain-amino-acid aminotransferase-like protein 2 [Acanthaster planci]
MADMKPKRLALWTHPRSLSTAMVMSFANYGSVEVFFEMYGGAFAFGPEKKMATPMPVPMEEHLTFDAVRCQLETAYPERDLVFMKDHALSLDGKYERLPVGFCHTFLIREPAQTVLSNYKMGLRGGLSTDQFLQMTQLVLGKTQGYKELVELVEHVEGTLQQRAVVLDADDLRRNPEGMLRVYCQAVDLPFRDSLLKWDPITEIPWNIPKSLLAFNQANGAYENALKSTGWIPPNPNPPDLSDFPKPLLDLMEEARPFYKKLYAKRLQLA